MKIWFLLVVIAVVAIAGVYVTPYVVTKAKVKETVRKSVTWTPESIQENPYLYLQSQIEECDKAKTKMEVARIQLARMQTSASRRARDAESVHAHCQGFLKSAKDAYKKANGAWPIIVSGLSFSQDELIERITDAQDRMKMAAQDIKTNRAFSKKAEIRKGGLEKKLSELQRIRRRLSHQAEQVKVNAELAEIDSLKGDLETIQDLMVEVSEDPIKFSLDDIIEEGGNVEVKQSALDFLNN